MELNTLHIILITIVMFASLNISLSGLFNINLIKLFSSFFEEAQYVIEKILSIVILIATIMILINIETYIPSIGETYIPLPKENFTPNGNVIIKKITGLPPNVKVIYWASIPKTDINEIAETQAIAYDTYANQGVATTNNDGDVVLKFITPISYKVPIFGTLKPHVNYRYWTENGTFSKLYKLYI
jgi:hypothetical protein